jgi:hypothetical protein
LVQQEEIAAAEHFVDGIVENLVVQGLLNEGDGIGRQGKSCAGASGSPDWIASSRLVTSDMGPSP